MQDVVEALTALLEIIHERLSPGMNPGVFCWLMNLCAADSLMPSRLYLLCSPHLWVALEGTDHVSRLSHWGGERLCVALGNQFDVFVRGNDVSQSVSFSLNQVAELSTLNPRHNCSHLLEMAMREERRVGGRLVWWAFSSFVEVPQCDL